MESKRPAIRILALCGSLGRNSSNLTLLHAALEANVQGIEVVLAPSLDALPHFNPDLEADLGPVEAVEQLRALVAASDALLIATPEYGFSMPGCLKNAVDWLIGSGELERKIVGLTASVPHLERGRGGIAALTVPLSAVSAQVVFAEPLLRDSQQIEGLRAMLRQLANAALASQASD